MSDGGDNKPGVSNLPGLSTDLTPGKAGQFTVLLQNKCGPPNSQEHSVSYLMSKRE